MAGFAIYRTAAWKSRAEGEAEALERFERHVRHGPPGARVDHVDATEEGVSGADAGFRMR